ncbi:MAG TPA: chorismate-binding protein, partial [Tepidisphaeraceae bacterium]|nr:chorismate-binding protein [Tepidisphaeraceae bacterium]
MCELGEIDVRLDSSDAGEAWNFRAGPAEAVLWCQSIHGPAVLRQGSGEERAWEEPLEALQWMSASQQEGRWIGFLSYDLGKRFERLPARAIDELGLPAFVFSRHRGGSSERGLTLPVRSETPGHVRSHFSRSEYQAAVGRAIEYIRAGDVFQVNLSQRFSVECELPAREVYARLTEKTPAKFGALLDYGRFALVSNSPELFLRVGADRKIVTRPIKGTRPVALGMEEELRASVKDQAELNMIVDLER